MSACLAVWPSIVFGIVNSSAKLASVAGAALLAAGAVVQPLRELANPAKGAARPSTPRAEGAPPTGPGMSAAMLGGLRGLVADGLWLKTYLAWADRDRVATERLIRLVTMVDDRPVYFWLNGARMIAYDITEWRRAARPPGSDGVEDDRRLVEEQARAALSYLAEARERYPDNAAICVEMANLHLYKRGDLSTAAEWYRRAAGLPDAPGYAARIYGELLRRLGRKREAYAWLCQLHPDLPSDDPEAMADVVLGRIRGLEEALGVPEGDRYRPVSGRAEIRHGQR